jgi:hypothetical protein
MSVRVSIDTSVADNLKASYGTEDLAVAIQMAMRDANAHRELIGELLASVKPGKPGATATKSTVSADVDPELFAAFND